MRPPRGTSARHEISRVRGRARNLERRFVGDSPGVWIWVGDYPADPDTTTDSPPFDNGWSNLGGGYRRLRFRLNFDEVVWEGAVTGGTSGTAVTTVPALYRPDEDTPAPGVGGDWLFKTTGELVFNAGVDGGTP